MTDETFEYGSTTPTVADDAATEAEPNLLAQLGEVVSKHVERKTIFIEVPERPGVTIRVSPNFGQPQLKAWRKQAGDGTKNGMDSVHFAARIIAACTTGIFLKGDEF